MRNPKHTMKKSRVKVIFDRKKTVAQKGTGKVEFYFELSRKLHKYLLYATVPPEQYESLIESPEFIVQKKQYERIMDAMVTLEEEMTIENLNRHLGIKPKGTVDEFEFMGGFLDFMREYIAKEKLTLGTRKKKLSELGVLEEFGKIKKFEDLTPEKIYAFDDYLQQPYAETEDGVKKYRAATTRFNYHKTLHTYVKKAVRLGHIPFDPYEKVDIERGRYKERNPLIESELLKMRNAKFEGKKAIVRDLFIFSAYTGMSYSDIMEFKFATMTKQVGDTYYVLGDRVKTGARYYAPILPPAMEVLQKYNFKLPRISNQKGNDYLHLIETELGFIKPLTFHVARHSFATLMLTFKVPIERVARMLGHTTTKHTTIYAKTLPKNVEDEVNRITDLLK